MNMLPELTVVVPITGRYENLAELYAAHDSVLRSHVKTISYIYVVDGGHAPAGEELERLAANTDDVQVIRLNREFGESTALSIAIDAAKTEWILTLPPYLQIEPRGLSELFSKTGDYDLISARRWPIEGYALNRMSNALFNGIVSSMTGLPFRDLGCGVRLMRKAIASEIPIYGGQHRFLPITANQRGFRVLEVSVPQASQDQKLKLHGPGTYARRLIDLLTVFFLVKFTKRPLRFFGMIGSAAIAGGVIVLAITAFQRLFMSIALADRPMLILGLLLAVLGVQLFAVGLIGELIIFVHARELKEYTVLQKLNFDAESPDDATPDLNETRQKPEQRPVSPSPEQS